MLYEIWGSELDKVIHAIIPTLKKTRQKVCHEFKVDESYRVKPCLKGGRLERFLSS